MLTQTGQGRPGAVSAGGVASPRQSPAQGPTDPAGLERHVNLEILAGATRQTLPIVVTTPLWALAICYALSGVVPVLGTVPWSQSLPWLFATVVGSGALLIVHSLFWRAKTRAALSGHVLDPKLWGYIYCGGSLAMTSSWAAGYWLLWIDDNSANHLFLNILMLAAIMNAVVGRSGHFLLAVVAVVPPVLIPQIKLMLAPSALGTMFMILSPTWAVWILFQIRNVCRDVQQAMRTRFEKEALADQLSSARDEADRLRANAERANVTKTAFLANMSHELRTPLNAILGFSEIISTQALGPHAGEKYRDYGNDILVSGRHLLSLINDLLDIAKIEAGKLEIAAEWIDARQAVQECVHLMEARAAAKAITMKWSVAPGAATIFADDRAFRQVMFNLVSNAIKFTPDGGLVTLSLVPAGPGAVLTVKDNGCGIPKDQIDRVFLPFEQVDNRYAKAHGGTGLGLTLVKALVELHGGQCLLASEEGEGTQVTVSFPFAEAQTPHGPRQAAAHA